MLGLTGNPSLELAGPGSWLHNACCAAESWRPTDIKLAGQLHGLDGWLLWVGWLGWARPRIGLALALHKLLYQKHYRVWLVGLKTFVTLDYEDIQSLLKWELIFRLVVNYNGARLIPYLYKYIYVLHMFIYTRVLSIWSSF